MGTLNMLGLAKRIGARFLLTSTSEVYGDPLEHPQKESYWGHVNPIGTSHNYLFISCVTIAFLSLYILFYLSHFTAISNPFPYQALEVVMMRGKEQQRL
jgi:nucleoside-diphosphate-sugar epimerase